MNAIHELVAGQSHTFAPAALNVTLTGTVQGRADLLASTVVLRAVDQAGAESVTVRLTATQVILTPEPRRVRLVASPASGGTFPAGTSIGMTVMTEGASVATQQILVAPTDVGALAQHELAVLEFAPGRSILTVAAQARPAPVEDAPQAFISGGLYDDQSAAKASTSAPERTGPPAPAAPPPAARVGDDHAWTQPGRYALRDTAQLGTGDRPAEGRGRRWAVLLDGSASMRRPGLPEATRALLTLASGVLVEWTGAWASALAVAGVQTVMVEAARTEPSALVDAAVGADEPSSWAYVAPAAARLAATVGSGGAVLLVTDGVPGDVAQLADVVRRQPDVRFHLLTFGSSPHGLASDLPAAEWWADDLSGAEQLAALPNVDVVSVRQRPGGSPVLDGSRAAELALRLTSTMGAER